MRFLTLLLTSLLLISTVSAKAKDAIDHISLAALLIKDTHYARALKELNKVDLKDENIDRKRFYTLRALAYMNNKNFKLAIKSFKTAIDSGHKDLILHIYIAQSYFKLKDYKKSIRSFTKAGELRFKKEGYLAMFAEAYWKLENKAQALDCLSDAIVRFPKSFNFEKQSTYLF